MKYYSDITHVLYNSAEELEKAEKSHAEKLEKEKQAKLAEKAKKDKLAEERATRAKEIEAAMDKVHTAEDEYNKLLKAFIHDYGSYHYSYTSDTPVNSFFSMIEPFFDFKF